MYLSCFFVFLFSRASQTEAKEETKVYRGQEMAVLWPCVALVCPEGINYDKIHIFVLPLCVVRVLSCELI